MEKIWLANHSSFRLELEALTTKLIAEYWSKCTEISAFENEKSGKSFLVTDRHPFGRNDRIDRSCASKPLEKKEDHS